MMSKTCPTCSKEFKVWKHEFERRRFCSKQCMNKGRTGLLNQKRSNRVLKKCPVCKLEFSVKKSRENSCVYCSRKCMAEGYKKKKIEHICLNCGTKFQDRDNEWRRNAKFCSLQCSYTYRVGENHPQWRNLTLEERRKMAREYNRTYYKNPLKKKSQMESLRKYKLKRKQVEVGHTWNEWIDLLKKHNNKCFYCGIKMTKRMGPKQRTRDHIVPIKHGGLDTIDNIVPACRSCNSSKGIKKFEDFTMGK
jgi:endogenous inhibitor of DNA gyrase (YacG/DUF329 family)